MLVLRPIGGGQARYYLEGPAPGRWMGGGSSELELRGPVDEPSLHALLGGHRPAGEQLLERLPVTRRCGFDLILAAPKSVSLLAAMGGDPYQSRLRQAHDQAVDSVIGYLERDAVRTRRGDSRQPTTGVVAAAFRHSLSGAGDPHLHSHVVVANLVHSEDGRWSTLDSRFLYRHARAAGALYQAALRHHVAQQGLHFEWTVDRHGLGDIIGVPRAAIDAASIRQGQVRREVESSLAGRRGRATAAGRTRRSAEAGRAEAAPTEASRAEAAPIEAGRADPDGRRGGAPPAEKWRQRVAAAGLDPSTAQRVLTVAVSRSIGAQQTRVAGPDREAMARLLSEQHSRFRRPDVVRAAAIVSVRGAPAGGLEAAADDFLSSAVPAGDDFWTTAGMKRHEERILSAAMPSGRPTAGLVAPDTPPPHGLSEMGRQAVDRLTSGGAPVDLLTGDLISQAQVLEAARTAWEASGHQVAMLSPTTRGQARWVTLAGLDRAPPTSAQPTVVVVDNAERWRTADLHRVVADASACRAKVVLLDGGSQPRRQRAESPAVETLRTTLATIDPGPSHPRDRAATAGAAVPAGRDGTVILAPTAHDAMARLVDDWHRRQLAGEHPRMVALGPEEAEHLNAMARAIRIESGQLPGPSVDIGGRRFQAGDEVAALRRDSRLGGVPGGTVGRVTSVDPDHRQATIEWAGQDRAVTVGAATNRARARASSADRPTAGSRKSRGSVPLTHGYATTPPYVRHGHDGPLLGLGHIEAVAPGVKPARIYDVAPTPTRDRTRDQPDRVSSLLAEVSGVRDRHHPAPGLPSDAGRSLVELAGERDRLADYLHANVPPDTRPELRRLAEERAALAAVPDRPGYGRPEYGRPEYRRPGYGRPEYGRPGPFGYPDRASRMAELDGRLDALTSEAASRAEWLAQHRDQLARCADLSHAIAWREGALGRGAELRPTVAVLSYLGPPTGDSRQRTAWRRAAEAVEAYRERRSLPDQPIDFESSPASERQVGRRADELRVLAAARELERARGRERGLDRALTPAGR